MISTPKESYKPEVNLFNSSLIHWRHNIQFYLFHTIFKVTIPLVVWPRNCSIMVNLSKKSNHKLSSMQGYAHGISINGRIWLRLMLCFLFSKSTKISNVRMDYFERNADCFISSYYGVMVRIWCLVPLIAALFKTCWWSYLWIAKFESPSFSMLKFIFFDVSQYWIFVWVWLSHIKSSNIFIGMPQTRTMARGPSIIPKNQYPLYKRT